jgi:endonuclease YncB( thermonuclease family)
MMTARRTTRLLQARLAVTCLGLAAGGLALAFLDHSAATPSICGTIAGAARVIDGDTLDVAGVRIRLDGIDAPESDQTCRGSSGADYACGSQASAVMGDLVHGRRVDCAPRGLDRYRRTLAICRTDAGELGAAMVSRGWAVDYTRYSGGRYHAEEAQARSVALGIWSGRFEMPWDWRHR